MASTALITREYKGQMYTFREDGYFNMTKAAKAFGKDIKEFFKNKSTTEYMEALKACGGISPDKELVTVKNGSGLYLQTGTWGHPKLAVFFARWLSMPFAVFCDMVIDDILNKKAELTITKPEESMALKVPQTHREALIYGF